MATKKKSSGKAGPAAAPAKAKESWASTIKQALQKKQASQGWPAEATNKSHASQSNAHAKLGRRNAAK